MKSACVEDEAASSVCAAVSSHSVPDAISNRVAQCPRASDVDLYAEIERYEKELLELQEEENLLRQTLELERMKRESEVKNERVKNVRGTYAVKVNL